MVKLEFDNLSRLLEENSFQVKNARPRRDVRGRSWRG